MKKVKITVLKKTLFKDLINEYATGDIKPCEVFTEGQEFIIDPFKPPEGFCPWAWNDIYKTVIAQTVEGTMYSGWMKDEKTSIACCSDGFRPVIFKIERLDEPTIYG